MTTIERSTAARFAPLRAGIAAARGILDELTQADAAVRAIKEEAKKLPKAAKERLREDSAYKARLAAAERHFKTLKYNLIPRCRRDWRGALGAWFASAIVVEEDKPVFPALLGTGGSDGRLDFTNNNLQRLADLFDETSGAPRAECEDWFRLALFGGTGRGLVGDLAVGQFQPGAAGGANAGNGPSANSLLNPADFVLMMEGTLNFQTAVTKRAQASAGAFAAAPFALPANAAAYSTASASDESARGEQWMPLWGQPLRRAELAHLLAEGRSRVGTKSAREPVQFARAITTLGVARGLDGFQRFGFIERNGQSNLAVPLGRFRVPERAHPRGLLVAELESWAAVLRRQSRDNHAPLRLQAAERGLTNSLFGALAHPAEPGHWQEILLSLAAVEAVQVTGSGIKAGPIPRLSTGWVAAADDGSPEFRLALAFALQHGADGQDPIRRHWLPLKKGFPRFETTGDATHTRLASKPEVVLHGREGIADAIALVERRFIEGAQRGRRHLPLTPGRHADAALGDLAQLLAGKVDLDRTVALGRALMALDLAAWSRQPVGLKAPPVVWPEDSWIAIRLASLPWPLDDHRNPGCDPAIFRRLVAGDASGALEISLRRLAVAGVRSPLRAGGVSPASARLWAASLAFPISRHTAGRLANRLAPAANKEQ